MAKTAATVLVLATRRSPLARKQAELARKALATMPKRWWTEN